MSNAIRIVRRFLLARLVLLVPVLLGVTVVTFSLIRLVPGDPGAVAIGPESRARPEALAALRAALRLGDTIDHPAEEVQTAARVGSDEFVVVLDDLRQPDDVRPVAQRLLDVLAMPYGVGLHQINCGVSKGVVMQAPAGGAAGEVLVEFGSTPAARLC